MKLKSRFYFGFSAEECTTQRKVYETFYVFMTFSYDFVIFMISGICRGFFLILFLIFATFCDFVTKCTRFFKAICPSFSAITRISCVLLPFNSSLPWRWLLYLLNYKQQLVMSKYGIKFLSVFSAKHSNTWTRSFYSLFKEKNTRDNKKAASAYFCIIIMADNENNCKIQIYFCIK